MGWADMARAAAGALVDTPAHAGVALAAAVITILVLAAAEARQWATDWFYYFSPVSYPGDAKKVPLTRLGTWVNRGSKLPEGWTFLHDEESHKWTEAQFGNKVGRQSGGRAAGRPLRTSRGVRACVRACVYLISCC